MTSIITVIVLLSFSLAMMLIIFGAFISMSKKGGGLREDPFYTDETRTIQQIHQGLAKMEKRIEALETILLERDIKDEKTKREREPNNETIG